MKVVCLIKRREAGEDTFIEYKYNECTLPAKNQRKYQIGKRNARNNNKK
jgi:hypothetical protein